jgi:hypothetical protein
VTAAALKGILAAIRKGGRAPVPEGPPAIRRLGRALAARDASPANLAVLLRQTLRYWSLTSGLEAIEPWVPAGGRWPASAAEWRSFGMEAQPSQGGFTLRALPWRPDWLADVPLDGVDAVAMAERPRRRFTPSPADPFVRQHFGREDYQSRAQQVAMRAAMSMPPGAVLLIVLSTGEGKSFAFQAVSEIGFGDGPPRVHGRPRVPRWA